MKGFGETIHQQCGGTEWSLGVNLCFGGQGTDQGGGRDYLAAAASVGRTEARPGS